jgi:hypothetical protein
MSCLSGIQAYNFVVTLKWKTKQILCPKRVENFKLRGYIGEDDEKFMKNIFERRLFYATPRLSRILDMISS